MQIEKLFRVLVVGGAALTVGTGCGPEETKDAESSPEGLVERLPDGGYPPDGGTTPAKKPTGGGVGGW